MAKISHTVKSAEMCKMTGDKVSFSVLPGSKDQGKPETSVACPFVPICLKHRTETLPAHCWPVSSEKVSNITSVIASTEYSYALREPKDLRRRTDRQDIPKCKTNTLNPLYYNTETQWSEDTHI